MLEALFILLLIAAGQGVFLSATLCTNRDKGLSNLFLGLIVLFFSLQLFDLVLLSSGKALEYPHLTFWSIPFNLAFGPLLYLYTVSIISKNALRKVHLFHFVPFLLHLIYISVIYHFRGAEDKIKMIQELLLVQAGAAGQHPALSDLLAAIVMYLQFAIYMVLSYRLRANQNLPDTNLVNWLRKLWLAILIIGLFGLVQFLLLTAGIDQYPLTGYLAAAIAVLYIYSGAIVLLKRPKVIFGPPESPKYQYSSLGADEGSGLLKRIRHYMAEHSPYKQPDLTLKQLATLMELPERHISQAINEQSGQNFSDFLNEYRVNEFKVQLMKPANKHLSLLGIAMDCGFNSKSTFNTVFKRFTGQTPSEFKRQQQENN
ncbi:MAG: helix-turn-helix transcriptional regulator [Roseivirga sp.]|nr:helix-turn-helix transcriptional regulator [Roseivirga sp.]